MFYLFLFVFGGPVVNEQSCGVENSAVCDPDPPRPSLQNEHVVWLSAQFVTQTLRVPISPVRLSLVRFRPRGRVGQGSRQAGHRMLHP